MLSGIGPRNHLTEMGIDVILDRPGVGSDLMDHNEIAINYEVDSSRQVWPAQSANIIDQIDDHLKHTNDDVEYWQELRDYLMQYADKTEQREGAGGIILDWYSGLDSDIGHDLHVDCSEGFWFDFDLSSTEPLPDGKLRVDYFRSQTNIHHPDFLRVFHHFLIEVLRPTKSEGTIRLASADPTVPPILDLSLYKDDQAGERLAHGIQMVRQDRRSSTYKGIL